MKRYNLLIFILVMMYSDKISALTPASQTEKKTVNVPMRDGVLLSTDIFFPGTGNDPLPVILMRTPINKGSIGSTVYYFVVRGYIVAVQDVRGRFASEGQWEPFVNEAEDGYDTIEWLAKQSWSNGKIGMMGGSYMAWVQFLAARLNPPHLAAIIPNCVPADPFLNSPWENGIFLLAPEAWWVSLMESGVKDYNNPQVIRESQKVKDDTNLYTLPVTDIDQKVFGKELAYWRAWLSHNKLDAYWEKASYMNSLKNLTIPVLLQSGWYDSHSIGTKLAWQELSKSFNSQVKMVIGPWNHANAVPSYPSTKNVGMEAAVDLTGMYLKWFDCWLRGIDNEFKHDSSVSIYVMNSKKWIDAEAYPLQETRYTRLYLSSNRGANSLGGDGKLSFLKPADKRRCDSYNYNPGDPTPAFIYRNSQGRKRSDEITASRKDILVYESDPLDSAITIAGPVSANIYASSSCVDTDWFVTLYAIDENDKYMPLVHGCLRARFRNSLSNPEFLRKNKLYEYAIDMWHTAIKLDKNWRIRVEIASADFPQYSRNLNTGGNNETEIEYLTAKQRIYHAGGKASCIILPVLPGE